MTPEPADSIRSAGLRVTSQRLAVLEALDGLPHADTDTIHRRVREAQPDISLQSVYVVLGALTEAGLIRRIEPAGSPALYERRIGDNHHHAICTGCGAVQDIDCAVGHAPCLTPAQPTGPAAPGTFAIMTAEVTYWGLCPACHQNSQNQQNSQNHKKENA
ncbi:Fur family transcriptional regulator [Subtercola boreus]|uniref:Transcriptional repressor n=1 Tax=Subtercola boreus TaxID=120213 RepID=A0A3E0W6U2_9MICO|nr:Fur family transcriptional regulator [Subtercola boreus]RFA17969.1 transcriptional repressor [Subtercola boreus]RFA18351.1 transcriptional repressor [Subtercola boreus]RFA24880.1 transcriptional repressor [Subtercola boreus]